MVRSLFLSRPSRLKFFIKKGNFSRKKFALLPTELDQARAILLEAAKKAVPKAGPMTPVCRDPEPDRKLAWPNKGLKGFSFDNHQDHCTIV